MPIVTQGWGLSTPEVECARTEATSAPPGDCVTGPVGQSTISIPPIESVKLTWEMRPRRLDAADFHFEVQRSESPGFRNSSDFETLIENRIGLLAYEDCNVPLGNHFRSWYYRIVATRISDPTQQLVSPVIRVNGRPGDHDDLIVREQRFNIAVLLAGWPGAPSPVGYTGVPCAILLARTYGSQCNECWDDVAERPSNSKCRTCYRTGWVGGFFAPIGRYLQFSSLPKRPSLELEGLEQRTFASVILEHDPELKPGDVIRDLESGRSWCVAQMEPPSARKLVTVHQNAVLYLLDRDDIEYEAAAELSFENLCELDWRPTLL